MLRNGWIQLELLVHGAYQREQIVVRLPVNEALPNVKILAIFADLFMDDTVHDVNRGGNLREVMRHMDSHKKRLVGAL